MYCCKIITLIHALTQCFYFCPSSALHRPLQVRIHFRDLKVEILYVWFSLQTLKDTANYNLALNDSKCYHGTHYVYTELVLCHVTSATIIYWAPVLCQALHIQWSLILQLWKTEDSIPRGKPAQVAQEMCGWELTFVTSSSPKLMLFFLYTRLASHMNPLIPVPFHVKSSPSLHFQEKDKLCFHCAQVVWKVTEYHFLHPVFQQFLGVYFSTNQG